MSFNSIGKGLVLLNFGLSVFFLAWAAAIFTQQIDWGWMDPRVETKGVRIASEVDKRSAAAKEAARLRERANGVVKNATAGVLLIEQRLPLNRVWYTSELKKLRSGGDKINVKHIEIAKTGVVLDPKEPGRPELKKPVSFIDAQGKDTPVEKSYESYMGDLKKVQAEINTTLDDIKKLVEDQEKLTVALNGVKEDGKLTRPGLYALMEMESQTQNKLKREIDDVKPRWVRELVEAQLLMDRRNRLEARRFELQKAFRPDDRK